MRKKKGLMVTDEDTWRERQLYLWEKKHGRCKCNKGFG